MLAVADVVLGWFRAGPTEESLNDIAVWLIVSAFAVLFLLIALNVQTYGKVAYAKGIPIPARFAWCFQEMPPVLWCVYRYFTTTEEMRNSLPNLILIGGFFLHYINRSFIYPFRIRNPKPVPLYIVVLAVAYCTINGYLQSSWLLVAHKYPESMLEEPRFIVGVLIMIIGELLTFQSDTILINLRKPGESGDVGRYKIPRGGLFEYVSAANMFSEIVIWTGFTIAGWNLPALSFVIYSFCNLAPRAMSTHEFYVAQFKGDYPKKRSVLIPFLF